MAFCNRLRQGLSPQLFEDGLCTRDFVHVDDVVEATYRAFEAADLDQQTLNIGGGSRTTFYQIATQVVQAFGLDLQPQVTSTYRQGDVRHMQADIRLAHQHLGYAPQVTLTPGIQQFVDWAKQQSTPASDPNQPLVELIQQGLAPSPPCEILL